MGVTKLTTNSFTGLEKYDSFLAGNGPVLGGSYQSIATATPSASATSITFSSISTTTWKHLQIRASISTSNNSSMFLQMNSDSTATNYYTHALFANGATPSSAAYNANYVPFYPGTSSYYGGHVIDILDAFNTNKYKTIRSLGGYDANGSGQIFLVSLLWKDTTAVSSITLKCFGTDFFNANCKIALYGVL